MPEKAGALAILVLSGLAARPLAAQEPPPPVTPAPAAESAKQAPPYRPLEGNVIINLPSIEAPKEGTLTILFTHRFQSDVRHSDIHNLFSFDGGANIGIGLWYAPLKNLNVGLYRSSDLDVYEATAQYRLPIDGAFGAALRVGEDWRTEVNQRNRNSFLAQAILSYTVNPYVRFTAVPTYLSRVNGFDSTIYPAPVPGDRSCAATPFGNFLCSGLYDDIFNVPVGLSLALTHSITVHGEVIPRIGKVNAKGVGWTVSVEKALLRHRFAFTAGSQRMTTADQYVGAIPFSAGKPGNIYLGFNIVRAWALKQ